VPSQAAHAERAGYFAAHGVCGIHIEEPAMSDHKTTVEENTLIGRGDGDVPLRVALPAYLEFGRRMDSQLRRLVVRWTHTASPGAKSIRSKPR
jgi:hypothetical protein